MILNTAIQLLRQSTDLNTDSQKDYISTLWVRYGVSIVSRMAAIECGMTAPQCIHANIMCFANQAEDQYITIYMYTMEFLGILISKPLLNISLTTIWSDDMPLNQVSNQVVSSSKTKQNLLIKFRYKYVKH